MYIQIITFEMGKHMAKTIQIRIDDVLKNAADELFASLGLDTSTAVRIFLAIAVENGGIPFEIKRQDYSLKRAMEDVLNKKNLSIPYSNARDAVNAMLED